MRVPRRVVAAVFAGVAISLACGDSQGPGPVPASITLRPTDLELFVGETEQLTATVLDSTGAQLTGQAVTFSSSAPQVAQVTIGGLVSAVGSGTAVITATAGAATGTADVLVRGPASIVLAPDSLLLGTGQQYAFAASVLDDAGDPMPNEPVTFTTSDADVFTVTSPGGVVTATGVGQATLTAAARGAVATAAITVFDPAVPVTLVVSPESVGFLICTTIAVSVVVYDAAGEPIDDAPVIYTSSDPSIATVDERGYITGRGVGSADIVVQVASLVDTVAVDVSGPLDIERICAPGRPFGVDISAAGVMYVSQPYLDQLLRFEVPSFTLTDSVDVGDNPGEVVLSADGSRLYTPEILGTAVSVVDVTTNQRLPGYDVGEVPFRNLPSHDGTRLYVASHTGVVHVFNLTTGAKVTAVTATPGASNGLVLSHDGTRLYASSIDGWIAEIDTGNNTVLRTWPVGGFLQDMVLSPDGTLMYVADETGPIKVIDVASGTETGTIGGTDGGFDLALSPDGSVLVVTMARAGTFLVLDRATGQITDTYIVGGTPRRIAFDAAGTFFAVANESGAVDIVR